MRAPNIVRVTSVKKPHFSEDWWARVENLFDANVSFKDKSVLDVGCNMGIVGYELCKQSPKTYHGVDILDSHINVANSIFRAVPVESNIESFDLTDDTVRASKLRPEYDVVLYLAVHQHLKRATNEMHTRRIALDLFARCKENLVFRGPDLEEIKLIAKESGFRINTEFERGRLNALCSFTRL